MNGRHRPRSPTSRTGRASAIARVIAHPLRARAAQGRSAPRRATSRRSRSSSSRSTTDDGIVGWGEVPGAARRAGLCGASSRRRWRRCSSARTRATGGALWKTMRARAHRPHRRQLVEAIAGRRHRAVGHRRQGRRPCRSHKLLGGMGRTRVAAYASSINWLDDATVEAEVAAALRGRLPRRSRSRLGRPVDDGDRARQSRARASPATTSRSMSTPTGPMTSTTRCVVGRALADLGYDFFEEPIAPRGPRGLSQPRASSCRSGSPPARATSSPATRCDLLRDRSIGLIQPDVARSGGITETWRIAELARALQHRLCAACRLVGRDLRRGEPAARGGRRDFRDLRVHGLREPAARCAAPPTPVGEAAQLVDGQLPCRKGPGSASRSTATCSPPSDRR